MAKMSTFIRAASTLLLILNISGPLQVLAQDCVVFEDNFNGSTKMQEVSQPYGDPNSGCIYGNGVAFSNDGEKEIIVLQCNDEAELRKTIGFGKGEYTIQLTWSAPGDAAWTNYNWCNNTHYDNLYGASCIVPKRLIIVDNKLLHETTGQLVDFAEVRTINYKGTMGKIYLAFGSNFPTGFTTEYDHLKITSKAPVPGFKWTKPGLEVQFTDTSLTANSWSWDFGDGTTSILKDPLHTYDSSGVYNVCLTVKNSCDQGATKCDSVRIDACVNSEPSFTYFKDSLAVDFTSGSRYASKFYWDFGDGFTSNEENPSHTYFFESTYEVCLTTTSNCGVDSEFCVSIDIDGSTTDTSDSTSGILHPAVIPEYSLQVYPNPASKDLHLLWKSDGLLPRELRILDLSGRMIYHTEWCPGSLCTLPLPHLAPGTYQLQISGPWGALRGPLQIK